MADSLSRLAAVYGRLTEQYQRLRCALGLLPAPIELPPLNEEQVAAVLRGLEHARTELIDAEPIEEETKTLLREALLGWLIAHTLMGASVEFGIVGYRLEELERIASLLHTKTGDAIRILGQKGVV